MGIKIVLCLLIPFVPLAIVAIAPVHPDTVETLDLFVCQFSFRVRPLLACYPLPQPFTSRCYIGTWDIQVAVFLIVGCSQCISLFPLGIKNAPHHANLFKLRDAFFLQTAIQLLLPGLDDPLSQGVTVRVGIFAGHHQVSVGVVVFLRSLKSMLPRNFLPIAPDHPDAVQPCDLLLCQIALDLPLAHTTLRDQPHAETQTAGRRIQFRDIQVAVLRVVDAGFGEIMFPTGRKACLKLLKQHPAVMHLLDDLEPLGHDLIALTIGIEPVNSLLHLALQTGNTGQPFEIVDYIQNQRGCGVPGG